MFNVLMISIGWKASKNTGDMKSPQSLICGSGRENTTVQILGLSNIGIIISRQIIAKLSR